MKPLVIPQTLGSLKAKKNIFEPVLKLVSELHWDLELIYVGKICLSWEILCWQYVKTKQCDSQQPHRYDLVANEFQLFQVLIQSFLEDDMFEKGIYFYLVLKIKLVAFHDVYMLMLNDL